MRVEEAEPKAELNPCPGLELDLPVTVEMDVTGGSHGFVTSGARNRGLLENFVQSFNKNNIWFFSSHHSFNLKVSMCSLLLCHVQSTRLAMFPWRELRRGLESAREDGTFLKDFGESSDGKISEPITPLQDIGVG